MVISWLYTELWTQVIVFSFQVHLGRLETFAVDYFREKLDLENLKIEAIN